MAVSWLGIFAAATAAHGWDATSAFRFDRDTFAFANQTVFEYHEGHASLRKSSATKRDAYNRHCFVMSRTALQFQKFARFDPRSAVLDDTALAARVRALTRQEAWMEPLPENQRIVFPGYTDLKEMSKARRELVQLSIGHGWPSYFRISNARMLFRDGYRLPGADSRSTECCFGARRVVRRISYNLPPVQHQSLGFDL